jgi:hypothetical protein
MSVRIKITITCDLCGKKAIEYFGVQRLDVPRALPWGWTRTMDDAFSDPYHWCDDCTTKYEDIQNRIIDSRRLGGLSLHSMCLYGVWAGRGRLVTNSEG